MSLQQRWTRWQERRKKLNKKPTNRTNATGYSSATLPEPVVVPRRPAPRIRLPLWAASAVWFIVSFALFGALFSGAKRLRTNNVEQPVNNEIASVVLPRTKLTATAVSATATVLPAIIPPTGTPAPTPTPIPTATPMPRLLADNWGPAIVEWQPEIVAAADPYQFSYDLIASIVNIESDGQPYGVSYAGAVGLMGIMPKGSGAGLDNRPSAEALRHPTTNTEWGTKILAEYLHQAGGDIQLALAIYNGGWGNVGSIETQTYALEVLHQTGYALATRVGVQDAAAIWSIDWQVCPCDGSAGQLLGTEIEPTILFDDGDMRVQGVPVIAVGRD